MKGKNIVLKMDEIKWNPKGAGLQRVWDSVQAGLNVRVYPTGKKVFYIRFNEHGKQRLRKLGDFPALSLENARSDAAEIRKKAKEGITAAATVRITMGELWEEITRNTVYPFHSNAFSTQKNYLIYWNSYITFKDLPVTEIKAKHWRSLILDYRDKGKFGTAKNIIRLAGTFYLNAQQHEAFGDLINPIKGIRFILPKSKEKKIFTLEQLRNFYLPNPQHNAMAQVMLLSGQRISEVCRMKWEHIDSGLWIVGEKGEMKNRSSAHHLPITDGIRESVDILPRASEWVFPGKPKNKKITTEAIKLPLKEHYPGFTPHCFRHSFASIAMDNDLDPYGISLILHHAIPGMTSRVYTHGQQLKRKKGVLDDFYTLLLQGEPELIQA
jgi:integrase